MQEEKIKSERKPSDSSESNFGRKPSIKFDSENINSESELGAFTPREQSYHKDQVSNLEINQNQEKNLVQAQQIKSERVESDQDRKNFNQDSTIKLRFSPINFFKEKVLCCFTSAENNSGYKNTL